MAGFKPSTLGWFQTHIKFIQTGQVRPLKTGCYRLINSHRSIFLCKWLLTWVTDTLESSTILIYFSKHMSLYRHKVGRTPPRLNGYKSRWTGSNRSSELKVQWLRKLVSEFTTKLSVLTPKYFKVCLGLEQTLELYLFSFICVQFSHQISTHREFLIHKSNHNFNKKISFDIKKCFAQQLNLKLFSQKYFSTYPAQADDKQWVSELSLSVVFLRMVPFTES
jgi:hypothetical protein